jgi:hypothetical protein
MLKLADIDGENVPETVSFIRGAMSLFKNANKMPTDMVEKICDIMQTSSVADYNDLFKHAKCAMLWDRKEYTADELLNKAKLEYKDLLHKGVWTRSSKSGSGESVFVATQSNHDNNTVTCWNCGKTGHTSRTCREPKHDSTNSAGGASKSSGSKNSWKKRTPGGGESHVKTVGGREWYWCGQCKSWNTTHQTTQHVKKASKGKLSTANANVVSPSSLAGPPSASTGRVSFAQSLQAAFAPN